MAAPNAIEFLKAESKMFKVFSVYMKELALVFNRETPPFAEYKTTVTLNYNKLYTKIK